MKITALEPQKRKRRRSQGQRAGPKVISVFLDGNFLFGLASETVAALGLHVGMEVDRGKLDDIAREEQQYQALQYAFLLLSYKARTTSELQQRLARKGFSPDIVSRTLQRLSELNMTDDAGFARRFAEDRITVGHKGKWRIRGELLKRGVAKEHIEDALATAPDEKAAAREVAEKYLSRNRRLEPDVLKRRLYAFLARRGFSPDTIRQVIDVDGAEST
ncbi:RecX family transcriptional regulator [candidate division WOR-3 bacterium]|nr:RecX family transcriptional regulator [candidate division WOR-3 bacterium]